MKTLKLRPLTILTCLVGATALGMAAHYSSPFNTFNLLTATSIKPADQTMATKPMIVNNSVMPKTIPLPSVSRDSIHITNPATIDLMRAVVLQSLESGVYTLQTLPIELKPFAPSAFSFHKNTAAEDKAEQLAEDTAEIEAKFAEMMSDDYVSPDAEFKCPDPNDLPPNLRNSHNLEALKNRGCEVPMELPAEAQQVQIQEPDVNYDESATYESSI
jgi:hypothetical protein